MTTMLSFTFLAALYPSLHNLLKEKIVNRPKSLVWKTFHHTSEVFQIIEPQLSWKNYSKSDTKKPEDRPKFTSELLQLALMLRYTLLPTYQLPVKHFPSPSVSLLKRLSQEGVEPLKAVKLLLNKRKIDKDIVLLA